MITKEQQKLIIEATKHVSPNSIAIFGSFARGEANAESDLDILIDFDTPLNLFDLIGLEMELSEILGIKVDLVTKRSVHSELKPFIEQDLVRIFWFARWWRTH